MPGHYRRYLRFIVYSAIAAAGSPPFAAIAQIDDSASRFSIRGFGTLGAVHSNEDKADFTGDFFQLDGPGYTHSTSISPDTRLGLQVDTRFNDRLSAVVQAVAQYNFQGNYAPEIEWANLAYEVSPDFHVRVGRFVAASFMVSESRLVGFAQPWMRPPDEVYSLLPITNKDGIDFNYRLPVGDATHNLRLSYGASKKKVPGGGEISVEHYLDLHDHITWGVNTLHFGYTSLDATFRTPNLQGLFGGLRQFGQLVGGTAGQQAFAIAAQRDLKNTPYSIMTVGITHDPGDLFLSAEWARADANNPTFIPDFQSWYVMAAYRHNEWTPYAIYADQNADKLSAVSVDTTGLPAPAAAIGAQLAAGANALNGGFGIAQRTISLGVRWDFADNKDLKFQFDRIRPDPGSNGWFINVQPGFHSGRDIDVLGLSVDFVF